MRISRSPQRRTAAKSLALAGLATTLSSLATLSVVALRNRVTDFERGLIFGVCLGASVLLLGFAIVNLKLSLKEHSHPHPES